MPNILAYLDRKKPYLGIPYAYCRWYLETPEAHRWSPLKSLYNLMGELELKRELTKITIHQSKNLVKTKLDEKSGSIEKKLIPKKVLSELTQEQIQRSRKIGIIIGVLLMIILLIIYVRGAL